MTTWLVVRATKNRWCKRNDLKTRAKKNWSIETQSETTKLQIALFLEKKKKMSLRYKHGKMDW